MPTTSKRQPQTPQPDTSGSSSNTPRSDAPEQAVPPASDGSGTQQAMQGDAADPASREERVRQAAYDAWLRRGGEPGDEVQDWLDAEAKVDRQKG
ncbi:MULTISPECIES: DUF2934 domain-containing protein [Variovorax]|nr:MULTISPECIES: DUF2934 domain-containing protein [Variovorax]WPG40187.1 DUF2934 domain-containing protein [Variovorax boronicumulans]